MDILSIAILIFIILETINVTILYFKPDSKLGNGVGVFNAWEESKKDANLHQFVRYLVYWVAGTKLIFICLLLVVLFTGSILTKTLVSIVLILSISSYFWRLNPIIKKLDINGHITPKGYSKGLGAMILGFIILFIIALLISRFF